MRLAEESESMKTDMKQVASWLQPEGIHLDVPLRDARHALEFVAEAIGVRHGLEVAPIFRALSRREQAGSTGLGAGLAIPHARIQGINRPLTLLVRAREPIDFNAPDRHPVSLVLAILVPEHGRRDDHLKLLALVAELFSNPSFRARMDTGASPGIVADFLRTGISGLAH
jgi:PTS system nitrogen regulatory IIA component